MPFKPGVSGNPSGRPKDVHNIRALAQKHCPRALQVIVDLLASENEDIRVKAARELLDRGYGKAIQQTEDIGNRTERDIIIVRTGIEQAAGRVLRIDAEAGSGVRPPDQPA